MLLFFFFDKGTSASRRHAPREQCQLHAPRPQRSREFRGGRGRRCCGARCEFYRKHRLRESLRPLCMSNRMGIALQITSIPQTLSNSRRNRRRSPTRSPSPRASSRVGTRGARSPPPPTASRPSARRRPRWAPRRRASSPTRRPACCPRLARIAYRCRDVFRKSPVVSNSIPKFKTQIQLTSYSMQCPKIHVLSMSNIMCDFSSHFY